MSNLSNKAMSPPRDRFNSDYFIIYTQNLKLFVDSKSLKNLCGPRGLLTLTQPGIGPHVLHST